MKKFKKMLIELILPALVDFMVFMCACCAIEDEYAFVKTVGAITAIVAVYGLYKTFSSFDMYSDIE